MRLPEDDKKDAEKIKQELLDEFEKAQLNREEAIQELAKRTRQGDESVQTFAYNVIELVKLACPSIDDETRGTIGKDYFVRGLHPDMQIALQSSKKIATNAIKILATEVTRLEIAGIKSNGAASTYKISSVDNPEPMANTLVDEIVDKVIEKLRGATLEPGNTTSHVDTAPTVHDNGINFTSHRGNFRGRQRGQFRGKYRNDFTLQ